MLAGDRAAGLGELFAPGKRKRAFRQNKGRDH